MSNALGVDQASFDDKTAKGMGDEDDGSFGGLSQLQGFAVQISLCPTNEILCHTYRSIGD